MKHAFDNAIDHPNLRRRAMEKLTAGGLPGHKRGSAPEALALLLQLATSAKTAGDALALLHELQVHQVELELQCEELHNSRVEVEMALLQQKARIDLAPAGFMTIDAKTVLCEINISGARLLGAERDNLLGLALANLLTAHGADTLQALMANARDGLTPHTGELQLPPHHGATPALLAVATAVATTDRFLLVVMAQSSADRPGDA